MFNLKLVTDKWLCNISLRKACLGISIFYMVFWPVVLLSIPGNISTWIVLIVNLVFNSALFFGVLRSNSCLVLLWLLHSMVFTVLCVITFFVLIFVRLDAFLILILPFIIFLVFTLYFTRTVYSFFHHMVSPPPAVAV